MFDKPQFEIPDAVRELAERNVEQARAAYGQFMQIAQQAQDMLARSGGVMASSAIEIQMRAMGYARNNLDASFQFASDLARARDLKEYLELQSRYAQSQMQAYQQQAQDLSQLMTAAAQKAQPKS
jgi:phasin